MADKRKIDDRESDKQYLERNGVNELVKEIILKLIANRPAEPIQFISEHFSAMHENFNYVDKAKQRLALTHHSAPSFMLNVRSAYDILSEVKVGKTIAGVNGLVYEQLLESICKDLPDSAKQKLLTKIKCRGHEAVNFDVFRCGVFAVFVMKDFLSHATELHGSMDVNKNGQIDRTLAETVLLQLHNSLTASTLGNAKSLLDSGYSLSPDMLSSALNQNVVAKDAARPTMSKDMFLAKAADAFLLKVNTLK